MSDLIERYLRLFVQAFREWVTSDPPRLRDVLRRPSRKGTPEEER